MDHAIMMPSGILQYYGITVLLEELHVDKKPTVIRKQLYCKSLTKKENKQEVFDVPTRKPTLATSFW